MIGGELADFVVLEPGGESGGADTSVPSLTPALRLAPGEVTPIALPISEAGVGAVVDVLYRSGGDELVGELQQALISSSRSGDFAHAELVSRAMRIFETCRRELRRDSYDALVAVDASARRAFEHDLTLAAVELHPRKFGLVVDEDGEVSVSQERRALEIYRRLRSTIADLDAKRRAVLDWSFTIPPNAHAARRQFEREALEPYCAALAAAGEAWPALRVLGSRVVKALADERREDVRRWAGQPGNDTKLDEVIRATLGDAFADLLDEQPDFRTATLAAADAAMASARRQVDRYWEEPPEATVGRLHPLWQHGMLIQAAMEQQGLRPGDIGHAAATAALRTAVDSRTRGATESAETDRMLGLASLGFGVLTLVPVVGQLALLAAITITAVQALEHAQEYFKQSGQSQALGHQAPRYAAAEPDPTALLCDLLSLTSDAALPVLGKVLGASVLRPTSRVIAATRVKTVLSLGERAADLAGLVAVANANATERELRRLGLLASESGRP